MRHLLVGIACFSLLTLFVAAQGRPGGGPGSKPITTSPRPSLGTRQTPDATDMMRGAFLSGKVVLEGGSELSEQVAIQTVCNNRKHTETYTDSHGNFSFQLGGKSSMYEMQEADVSAGSSPFTKAGNSFQWRSCELQAVLPGFTSEVIELARVMSTMESADVGRIVLHPMSHVQGTTMSVTTLAAPKDARKAYEKARDQEKKKKLDEALPLLQKAVQIYPQYAVAWCELGRVQYLNHDVPAARHSLEQSLAADAKYVNPYLWLAQMAYEAKQWKEVVEVSGKMLALNPINFPGAWYLNAVGHLLLHEEDAAEKAAREGLKIDEEHRFPKLDYLLGVLLIQKRDYAQAAQHMRQYQHLSTEPAEIAEAQKQLAQIEQLSASAKTAAAGQQK